MKISAYQSTAQWFVGILETVREQFARYTLKDTFQFVEVIKDANIKDKRMFSLDVISLFTNVPLIETVNFICEFIEKEQIPTAIPVGNIKELILKCTLNVQFLFNGVHYRQKDGVAMGSPLGPLLADVFMAKMQWVN
ncbi:hypothetical protein [Streptococcus dysgalactiae]|uniref:hypothetical protein n=1 Tax=Streptococcus dysgalactiae TaxID=1334 RepID=UPI0019517420|nr:hypothetical protein [Streptococcus dysgalactiae]MBM6549359.1 hypothetical protein [Streptococcus dysgalactiae subsp. equisimilis]